MTSTAIVLPASIWPEAKFLKIVGPHFGIYDELERAVSRIREETLNGRSRALRRKRRLAIAGYTDFMAIEQEVEKFFKGPIDAGEVRWNPSRLFPALVYEDPEKLLPPLAAKFKTVSRALLPRNGFLPFKGFRECKSAALFGNFSDLSDREQIGRVRTWVTVGRIRGLQTNEPAQFGFVAGKPGRNREFYWKVTYQRVGGVIAATHAAEEAALRSGRKVTLDNVEPNKELGTSE